MNEKFNDINRMSLPELEIAKKLIDELLDIKPKQRLTNLEYIDKCKTIVCPINENHHIKRNGHKDGTQRFWCHDCKKSFSISEGSISKYSSLNYYQIKKLLQCMYDFKPLNEIASEIGISKTSTFELEIRIFDALDQIENSTILSEVVQADEMYIRTSFKGFKNGKMPRPSRYNGNSDLTSGISEDQVCIVCAIDSYDNIVIKVVGNSSASNEMIDKALKNKIKEGSTLVTDSKNSYNNFAKEMNLKLVKIPSGYHKIDNYTINDVNEIMTEISIYLKQKRGISSRHLQHHMNFIRYRKILKYTIEYLEINEQMYIDSLLLTMQLKCDDVYSTDIPFDIDEYKIWYGEHHPNWDH
jgi:transposase-like protein